jgi:uncharacterized lipoprotein YajG
MVRISVLVVAAGILAGCVYSEDVVPIHYDPSSGAARIEGAGAVTVAVVDGRSIDRNRISTKINGYGASAAAIRSATDVRDVVRDALTAELEQRGFRIESADRVVTATIRRFYNDYASAVLATAAKADVDLEVTVSQPGAALFTQTYDGFSESAFAYPSGSNAAESVAKALRNAIDNMFADPEFVQSLTGGSRRIGQRG